jgi:hypothetical protein
MHSNWAGCVSALGFAIHAMAANLQTPSGHDIQALKTTLTIVSAAAGGELLEAEIGSLTAGPV